MRPEPIEWESSDREPDRWRASVGCLTFNIDQWTNEEAAGFYVELDVPTVDAGKALAERVRQTIEIFFAEQLASGAENE